jgi:hypothetical protein
MNHKLGSWAGMLGPAIFVGVFFIEGALRPGYDPVSMFISELSLGPRGGIQIANFLITGILFFIFARGLAAEFKTGKASRFGPLLMTLIAVGFFVSGPAVMDPTTTLPGDLTTHGLVHSLTGALVFLFMPISAFVFLRRFREDAQWKPLTGWTLTAAILMVIFVIVLRVASPPPGVASNALTAYDGLIQRGLVITFQAWAFTFAYRLNKLA